ncbi:GNAT family N-acetyltransferase [Bermanella marisrubri]|uniref:N-acetyltransferase domain-containing protein n=1 Tax=Bermanella marisrubri TaxID=207949 RepID=Q1N386_9GAMM|nr:GNAT family N-acetyltransferase [Bermanella marisrubri]EAT12705.1 hypothetical protein RED65_13512 [Oceanobacter sp. RED65] [Bermanella marisrubri]QIZ85174.1 GNAT family N-acetyltransferase [Bermanella marisrubri]
MDKLSGSQTLQFKPVDFDRHEQLCLQFRKDAHLASYGSLAYFNEEEMLNWFRYLIQENPEGFKHVWLKGQIIGQIEYKAIIEEANENNQANSYSYINLFYLKPEYRNLGLGQQLHDFVVKQCQLAGSREIFLRYIPGNKQAKAFYRKNGWLFSGEPDYRGQLMVLDLT